MNEPVKMFSLLFKSNHELLIRPSTVTDYISEANEKIFYVILYLYQKFIVIDFDIGTFISMVHYRRLNCQKTK